MSNRVKENLFYLSLYYLYVRVIVFFFHKHIFKKLRSNSLFFSCDSNAFSTTSTDLEPTTEFQSWFQTNILRLQSLKGVRNLCCQIFLFSHWLSKSWPKQTQRKDINFSKSKGQVTHSILVCERWEMLAFTLSNFPIQLFREPASKVTLKLLFWQIHARFTATRPSSGDHFVKIFCRTKRGKIKNRQIFLIWLRIVWTDLKNSDPIGFELSYNSSRSRCESHVMRFSIFTKTRASQKLA